MDKPNVGIAVVGEMPYAESVDDKADLSLSDTDVKTIDNICQLVDKLIVVIISGRHLIMTDQLSIAWQTPGRRPGYLERKGKA